MKVLIIGLPSNVKDETVQSIINASIEATELPLKGIVIEEKDMLTFNVEINKDNKESDFIRAIKAVVKTIGDNPDTVEARTEFYQLVLSGKIEKPIVSKIAFGPTNSSDQMFLRRNKLTRIVEYARVALSLIA